MSSAVGEMFCPTCFVTYPPHLSSCPRDSTPLIRMADPKDPLVGASIEGRFTLRERIGGGGMGVVYAAIQHSLGREVALKLIRPDRESIDAAKRFLREARLLSRLTHPSIVAVLDSGQAADGTLFIAMELLRGRTLSNLIRESGRLSVERSIEIGLQIADALDAAHRASIIHRDLKPANVMLLDETRDRIKVLDFGLARSTAGDLPTMTEAGRIMGTPKAIAPETALGQRATTASDVYAAGVILYEMLSGAPPFEAEHVRGLLYRHIHDPPPPLDPEIPAPMQSLVYSLLEKEPSRRPSVAQLRNHLAELASSSSPRIEAPPLVPQPRRTRTIVRAAGFMFVVIIALIAGMWIERRLREPPETTPVDTVSQPSIAAVPGVFPAEEEKKEEPPLVLTPEPERRRAPPIKARPPEKEEPAAPPVSRADDLDRRLDEPMKSWIDRLITSARRARDRLDAGPRKDRATQLLLDLSRLAASPRLEAEAPKVAKLARDLSALENE